MATSRRQEHELFKGEFAIMLNTARTPQLTVLTVLNIPMWYSFSADSAFEMPVVQQQNTDAGFIISAATVFLLVGAGAKSAGPVSLVTDIISTTSALKPWERTLKRVSAGLCKQTHRLWRLSCWALVRWEAGSVTVVHWFKDLLSAVGCHVVLIWNWVFHYCFDINVHYFHIASSQ